MNPYPPPPPGPGYGPYGAPPPPAWGTPPPPPSPQKGGPSVGLILGIGCAALAFVGLLVGGAIGAVMMVRRAATESAPATSARAAAQPPPAATTAPPKAELRDVRTWKSAGGLRRVVGEIVNTGTEPVQGAVVKVTFYDAQNVAIDSSACSTPLTTIEPGGKMPCSMILLKSNGYASYRADIQSLAWIAPKKAAELRVTDVKFTPKRGYMPATLDGKITNASTFRARGVAAVVSLYGSDGKIVAAETAPVAGGDLDAGAAGLFSAKIFDYAAPPETYRVKAIGYERE